MKTAVITGSTRGLGHGLARAFLVRGCAVVVSGRTERGVDQAVAQLAGDFGEDRVAGFTCDVTDPAQVQGLWDSAAARFGPIAIWINNAGLGHAQMRSWEIAPGTARAVVETNLLGAIYGAQVAMKGMQAQGGGSLYLMEGAGSDGRKHEGLSLYATSKYGLRYFIEALVAEAADTPVLVGALRPGMVLTELITDQFRDRPQAWERFKPIFNILGDRVETVAPWLADQILANDRHGATITWLTRRKLITRFLRARFQGRDLFGA